MGEEGRQGKFRSYLPYALLLAAYLFVGALASHPFDDAIYAQNAQFFYFFRVPPVLSLPMGLYYDAINVGGYFITILLGLMKVQNVITIQIGVKIPFIIFSFLTAFVLYRIGSEMDFNGKYASLILLTSPIYFFTALIYGSAIIVSVFFLIASLFFIIRKKTAMSAVFYGMSMGSYLYPIIAIPILLRYFWVREGRKSAGIFLLVSSVFFAIGQFVTFLLYFYKGIQSQAPISPTTFFGPMTSVQPYSPLDILNIFNLGRTVPGETINILYYGSAIIASLIYFLLPRDKVNLSSLVIFLFVQGILFSSLAPGNLPSYMAAGIPLAIIVAFMFKRWIFIGLIWVSSFFSFWVMQTINPVGFLIYFSDINHKILSIKNMYPSWAVDAAGSIYTISILLNLLFLRQRKREGKWSLKKTVVSQSSVISVIVVVGMLVLMPVAESLPSGMYLAPEVNTFQSTDFSPSIVNGDLVVKYYLPLLLLNIHEKNEYLTGVIVYDNTRISPYNVTGETLIQGNHSYSLQIPYPIRDAEMTLYSPDYGSMSIYLEADGAMVMPANSSIVDAGTYEYRYSFSPVLDGNYILNVESTVPFYSGADLPAVNVTGYLAITGENVDGSQVNGSIPGYLISDPVTVEFHGPFSKIPPSIPSLFFYVNPTGSTPGYAYVAVGGVIFFALVIAAVVFVRRL